MPLGKGVATTKNEITLSTMEDCECLPTQVPKKIISSHMNQSLLDLKAADKEIAQLDKENDGLREYLAASQAQVDSLKTEMLVQQNKHLEIIQSLSQALLLILLSLPDIFFLSPH